jgi:hypothetical protein
MPRLYDDPACTVRGDSLETDTLNEGFVFESTAAPPLRTSTSPRTVMTALVVALLNIVMQSDSTVNFPELWDGTRIPYRL